MKQIKDAIRTAGLQLAILFLLLLSLGTAVAAQTGAQQFTGRWIWKQTAQKNKPQIQFRLVIQRQGNVLRGVYSVDEFINGEWQGEDGNQTPFIGRLKGNELQIEFDPMATVPGYEQNVRYVAPTDGRKPSKAVIQRRGSGLMWTLTLGPGIERVPDSLNLSREQR
jgi:hypothetical protein